VDLAPLLYASLDEATLPSLNLLPSTVILSLLHTFPFVMAGREIRSNADGLNPNGYGQLYYSWFVSHKVVECRPSFPSRPLWALIRLPLKYYWSGFAALVPLLWLCWASYAPFRNRFYEIFKLLHIISAILFSGFFYIHCNAVRPDSLPCSTTR
jgi:hypothetical protein